MADDICALHSRQSEGLAREIDLPKVTRDREHSPQSKHSFPSQAVAAILLQCPENYPLLSKCAGIILNTSLDLVSMIPSFLTSIGFIYNMSLFPGFFQTLVEDIVTCSLPVPAEQPLHHVMSLALGKGLILYQLCGQLFNYASFSFIICRIWQLDPLVSSPSVLSSLLAPAAHLDNILFSLLRLLYCTCCVVLVLCLRLLCCAQDEKDGLTCLLSNMITGCNNKNCILRNLKPTFFPKGDIRLDLGREILNKLDILFGC